MSVSLILVNSAYTFLWLGLVGCVMAGLAPFWFTSDLLRDSGDHPLRHFGILTYCNDSYCGFMPGRWVEPIVLGLITYSAGLALSFLNLVVSSAHVCCYKSKGYKFCCACGILGLMSVLILVCSVMALGVLLEIGSSTKVEVDWAFILAIVASSLMLLSSIIYLSAGCKQIRNRSYQL